MKNKYVVSNMFFAKQVVFKLLHWRPWQDMLM